MDLDGCTDESVPSFSKLLFGGVWLVTYDWAEHSAHLPPFLLGCYPF